jgi:hypothetical protein
MLDPLLRTELRYQVRDSLEFTKRRMKDSIDKFVSGKMDEESVFTYQAGFLLSPILFNGNYHILYRKGRLEMDGENTLIHFTMSLHIGLIILVLLILPL